MKEMPLTYPQSKTVILHYQNLLKDWEIYSQFSLPENHPIDEPFDSSNSIHFVRCRKGNFNISLEEACLKYNLPQPLDIFKFDVDKLFTLV